MVTVSSFQVFEHLWCKTSHRFKTNKKKIATKIPSLADKKWLTRQIQSFWSSKNA